MWHIGSRIFLCALDGDTRSVTSQSYFASLFLAVVIEPSVAAASANASFLLCAYVLSVKPGSACPSHVGNHLRRDAGQMHQGRPRTACIVKPDAGEPRGTQSLPPRGAQRVRVRRDPELVHDHVPVVDPLRSETQLQFLLPRPHAAAWRGVPRGRSQSRSGHQLLSYHSLTRRTDQLEGTTRHVGADLCAAVVDPTAVVLAQVLGGPVWLHAAKRFAQSPPARRSVPRAGRGRSATCRVVMVSEHRKTGAAGKAAGCGPAVRYRQSPSGSANRSVASSD